MNKIYKISRGLYSSIKLNCFPHEYIWDEYPSTISILPYTWNNDVFRDKKNFWCIKITNQIILLLKGYTNLVKEQSLLHSRLRVWPFMNILPHQLRICEYISIWNLCLICKNIAPRLHAVLCALCTTQDYTLFKKYLIRFLMDDSDVGRFHLHW